MSNMKEEMSEKKSKKVLLLGVLGTVLVVAIVVCTVAGVGSRSRRSNQRSHAIIKNACSSTLYQELCFSSITSEPAHVTANLISLRDVIELALNIASRFVQRNYFIVEKLLTREGLSKGTRNALHDCLETIDSTLDDLEMTKNAIKDYPISKNNSVYHYADKLKTLMSSAITNQLTCLDGFSHDKAEKFFRKLYLLKPQVHAEHLCSNALAMVKNLTDTDIANYENNNKFSTNDRKLISEDDDSGVRWPHWLSEEDRRLLQSGTDNPDVVVAADNSGDFTTVSAAVAAAPENSKKRYVIRIKAGVYRESVEVTKKKINLMFLGDGSSKTIITASKSAADDITTFASGTVIVVGERFLARGITMQNAAGPANGQAVALRVGADFSAFYLCSIIAYQDTLYVHSNRQFFVKCFIAGTVDFIFGNSAVVLQDCDIHARPGLLGQENMVTAQGRSDINQNTGIVIQKCRIGATSELQAVQDRYRSYLGRPWQQYSRTVVMQSTISNVIDPAGWHSWNNSNFALDTLFYAEYKNTGDGADTSHRVTWKSFRVFTTDSQALPFTAANFIAGSTWLPSTGFPYQLGL
ncbi:hypothetical protein VNO77_18802 [Canavalia gladiata]|uniref:Pectinesterase n=1 Tax=Canavalia gladiata TaxID=3824 RepID=A0AAN9LLD4_CANGL